MSFVQTIMKNNDYYYTTACVRGSKPPCTCACPVNFDIKGFLKKIRAGNFNGAYRNMAEQLLFPDIVALLCDGCCSGGCGAGINVNALEQICVKNAKRREPNNYRIPRKKERAAIVGAGLSGLSCALQLSSKKYDVTVYEMAERIGGTLYDIMDPAVFLADFELQFRHAPYTLVSGHVVSSIDELSEYDAIYIATGFDGDDFGLRNGWNPQSMATVKTGVFLGGSITDGDMKIKSLADGIAAASSIERFLRTGSMNGQPESFIQRKCKFETSFPPDYKSDFIITVCDSDPYEAYQSAEKKAEAAQSEAKRCLMCDCTVCMDNCEFMKHIQMYPQEIETDVLNARITSQGLIERAGSRMIFSCSVCGKCGSVCPEGISLDEMLLDSKKMLFDDRKYPEALHDFYIRDMNDAMGSSYLVIGRKNSDYLLFPGCQTAGSSPEYISHVYDYMLSVNESPSLMLGCCGIPAVWSGNEKLFLQTASKLNGDWEALGRPVVVAMCPTCIKTFKRYFPEWKVISIYEFVVDNGLPERYSRSSNKGMKSTVFDPCASRDFPEMQNAVRKLAEMTGNEIDELPYGRERASCCGNGGHIYPASPASAESMIMTGASQSHLPYIAYCINCRNHFLSSGKECRHILDDVFCIQPLNSVPHIAELRRNRRRLISDLTDSYPVIRQCCDDSEREMFDSLRIEFPEDILRKMDKFLISEDEICQVIIDAENDGRKIMRKTDGAFVSFKQIGIITYWVVYTSTSGDDDGHDVIYYVKDAYCHRVMIDL